MLVPFAVFVFSTFMLRDGGESPHSHSSRSCIFECHQYFLNPSWIWESDVLGGGASGYLQPLWPWTFTARIVDGCESPYSFLRYLNIFKEGNKQLTIICVAGESDTTLERIVSRSFGLYGVHFVPSSARWPWKSTFLSAPGNSSRVSIIVQALFGRMSAFSVGISPCTGCGLSPPIWPMAVKVYGNSCNI